MLKRISITNNDIIEQTKLSCKMSEIVEKIVSRKVIESYASDVGIKIESGELQSAADNFRVVNKLENTEDTWRWMEKNKLSIDEFEKIASIALLIDKLVQHLFANKVEGYFYQNILSYSGAVLYEIILEDLDIAQELFYTIHEGETSFFDVARQYIKNTELRRQGGYKGIVQRKNMAPEISAAVFAAKPPQLLKPILTARGVHLIFVESIIQPQLDDTLRQRIALELFHEWLFAQTKLVTIDFQVE